MSRFGHKELEAQFLKAIRQVKARLRKQSRNKRSLSNLQGKSNIQRLKKERFNNKKV